MSDFKFVTLQCPSCGGALSVGASADTMMTCGYCGSSVTVDRGADGAALRCTCFPTASRG